MKEALIFKEALSDQAALICNLIMECFNEFVAPGYSREGIQEFSKYVDPAAMRARLKGNYFIFTALFKDHLAGMIEVRDNNHISLFFVERQFQNKGIAKKLLSLAIERCRKNNPGVKIIEVNSSPFAVPIYTKLGFIKINEEQLKNGIRFTPMTLDLTEYPLS
jgi:GNAT superfamily N-acetyltransferase